MRRLRNAFLVLLGTTVLARGHHGLAAFDTTTTINVKGTVTEFHFVNPHCVVEFDVKDEKGQIQKWQGEFSNPSHLSRKGWTAATLQPGDKIAIAGNPAKNHGLALHVTWIRLPNGQEFQIEGGR